MIGFVNFEALAADVGFTIGLELTLFTVLPGVIGAVCELMVPAESLLSL